VVFVFLSFPPYHFFFPSFEASWFSFYLELLGLPFNWPVFSTYFSCTHASSIVLGLKNITLFKIWLCSPPQILEEYIWVLGIDTQHDGHLFELIGVLLYTLLLPLPQVVPLDPLVLYIHDMVEFRLDEGFEVLPPSYW
jgi:hypothetical protein